MLNEGKRFRHLDLDVFLTPDPLEYVDGFNPYIYCSQNPWGRWDSEGLSFLGYETAGDYFKEVANVYKGYGLAIKDTVKGLYNIVRHPIDTANGIAKAVVNPVDTAKAIGSSISETWNSGSEGQGRVIGDALITIATSGVSVTKAGNLGKAGQVTSAAEKAADAVKATEKTAEVANAGSKANSVGKIVDVAGDAGKADVLPANPFKGKSDKEIASMFDKKGFVRRGPDPVSGKGGWVDQKTGRSFHLDNGINKKGQKVERAHVDINRSKKIDMPKKKIFIEKE